MDKVFGSNSTRIWLISDEQPEDECFMSYNLENSFLRCIETA